jgi:hypothetical protein
MMRASVTSHSVCQTDARKIMVAASTLPGTKGRTELAPNPRSGSRNTGPIPQTTHRIHQVLDEVLAQQEGEFDTDTHRVLSWFEQC